MWRKPKTMSLLTMGTTITSLSIYMLAMQPTLRILPLRLLHSLLQYQNHSLLHRMCSSWCLSHQRAIPRGSHLAPLVVSRHTSHQGNPLALLHSCRVVNLAVSRQENLQESQLSCPPASQREFPLRCHRANRHLCLRHRLPQLFLVENQAHFPRGSRPQRLLKSQLANPR